MGRQAFTSPSFEAETSEEKVLYWRNVSRSVIFLERSVPLIFFAASFWITNVHSAGLHIIQVTNHGLPNKI
jgi:hypothetical protein